MADVRGHRRRGSDSSNKATGPEPAVVAAAAPGRRSLLGDGSMGIQVLTVGYALLFLIFGGSMQEARDSALEIGRVGTMGFIKG